MNTLPKSFGVLNDGSQLFKDTVIPFLNSKQADLTGCMKGWYYGIDFDGVTHSQDPTIFDSIITLEQFIEMTKEKQILTEDNIKDYGFEEYRDSGYWRHFSKDKFVITQCLYSDENFKKGNWHYGMDNILINTVEELKMLYKLITKKELI